MGASPSSHALLEDDQYLSQRSSGEVKSNVSANRVYSIHSQAYSQATSQDLEPKIINQNAPQQGVKKVILFGLSEELISIGSTRELMIFSSTWGINVVCFQQGVAVNGFNFWQCYSSLTLPGSYANNKVEAP